MSAKAIREFDGKQILFAHVPSLTPSTGVSIAQIRIDLTPTDTITASNPSKIACLDPDASPKPATLSSSEDLSEDDIRQRVSMALNEAEKMYPWVVQPGSRLVVKPDQLIKRRGKSSLLLLDADWQAVKQWVKEKAGRLTRVAGGAEGRLSVFVVEPFIVHKAEDECYVCMRSVREGDEILFCRRGGVDVGDVELNAQRLLVPIGENLAKERVRDWLDGADQVVASGMERVLPDLFKAYCELHFTYLEINPLVVRADAVHCLDLAARVDQTAEFEVGKKWACALHGGRLEFPGPFGRDLSPEEAYIEQLDGKTGASLKLTILNPAGRIWTMVAGGGASVAYADAICAHGFGDQLANYGEYSGAPSENQTYEYSRTILDLMTRGQPLPQGKILLVGGGIANFTNVATTFKGIIRAIVEYKHRLMVHNVDIWVRRGGPNYQEGLKGMRELGESIGIAIHVYGPETHITAIVPMALGISKGSEGVATPPGSDIGRSPLMDQLLSVPSDNGSSTQARTPSPFNVIDSAGKERIRRFASRDQPGSGLPEHMLFDESTRAVVYGMQPKAVQGMLDFDFICKRQKPSVAAMVYPFGGQHVQKFYWGTQETLLPVYPSLQDACRKHPDVTCMVNFASFRSVWESCEEAMAVGQIKTIAIIAEGVPERRTRMLIRLAGAKGVRLVGPATVGGLRAGAFKIGNTGGMIDNILASRLYRPGSVCYVSKSGGMSNELNNVIARCTDGVLEGIAIGGDRFPGSTLLSHLLRFEADPDCRVMVMLGEVGGREEWAVAAAVQAGQLTKPLVAWCIGTCSEQLAASHGEVQFGHAGAQAGGASETSRAKNKGLADAGAIVPATFEELPRVLADCFSRMCAEGKIEPRAEPPLPKVPIDYAWAAELGLIRKPTAFVSTICDDRGQELLYAGMPISSVFKEQIGIGGVVGLLWFRRRLPEYAGSFIEMVLMLTADHGPAVSGAHNTIVAARAGKDLISSLASGLLTIGERFGGALDGAAEQFSTAYDQGLSPQDFVDSMRRQHRLIMGIGHKIKSVTNPDLRVSILKDFARRAFPSCALLDYALQVEQITTTKKDNLILNVDGAIAVLFVDLLRSCGAFTRDEADEFTKAGTLNGLFVLGRSIGFIGHYLDQKQLRQGLYRHPWDDISYLSPAAVDLAKLAPPSSSTE